MTAKCNSFGSFSRRLRVLFSGALVVGALATGTVHAQTTQAVTLRIVDGGGDPIDPAFNPRVRVNGVFYTPGTPAMLAPGNYTADLIPFNFPSLLLRTQPFTVDNLTTMVDLEWITVDVPVTVESDGSPVTLATGTPLVQMTGDIGPNQFTVLELDSGDVITLPILDTTVYPTIQASGFLAEGYDFCVIPFGSGNAHLLERVYMDCVVTQNTTEIDLEWTARSIPLTLVDGVGGSPVETVTGSSFNLQDDFGNDPIATSFDSGAVITLPATDVAGLSANSQWADGYNLRAVPYKCGNVLLARQVAEGPFPVTAATTELDVVWETVSVPINVQDPLGAQCSTFDLAAIKFYSGDALPPDSFGPAFATGDVITVPVVGNSVYTNLTGDFANGYNFRVQPFGDGTADLLVRTYGEEVVEPTTTSVDMEWITIARGLDVGDALSVPVANSTINLPLGFDTFFRCGAYGFPATDDPGLGGDYAMGYPMEIIPGDISPTGAIVVCEVLSTRVFSPGSFIIGANTYSLLTSPDSDCDGLSDAGEAIAGTNPLNPDTDGDGLLDGAEIASQLTPGCPDPLDADSDNDCLTDGDEACNIGTNPCLADTDGDTLSDHLDPTPLDPGITSGVLEDATRIICAEILALDHSLIIGKNANTKMSRRTNLSSHCSRAANDIANGQFSAAASQLAAIQDRVDGIGQDWVVNSPERIKLYDDLTAVIALLQQP